MNRLLKFYINENSHETNYTVFHQFSGRMGPTAITRFDSQYYVALFQFEDIASTGAVAVINSLGEMIQKFIMPIGPQITGLYIDEKAMVNNCSAIYVS